MTAEVACPYCQQIVEFESLHRDDYGENLIGLAAINDFKYRTQPPTSREALTAPEELVPRLGDYLIDQGILREDDLNAALSYKNEKAAAGRPCLIGQALVEMGLIDQRTLDKAITEQILKLHEALKLANLHLEQRVLERTNELQQALQRLSDLNQLKANFIANVSHELRTPLTHIKGYLDMLSDGSLGSLTPQQSDALKVIQKAEIRLEEQIDDLIQFSLATRGELSLDLKNVDIAELITNSTANSHQKALANQVTLQTILPENLPSVIADKEKIGWVLIELLDNAIKFTPQGGHVKISAMVNNGFVAITVRDTGIGIPSNEISEIFEPFHQIDGSITRRYPGTGLGLALAKRITNAHGASLCVNSRLDEGTEITISMPFNG